MNSEQIIPIDRARVRERVDRARERKGRFIWLKARLIDLPLADGHMNMWLRP